MIKEYYNFIKEYIRVAQIKISYLIFTIITSILYKGFLILIPLFSSWIIKYATSGNFNMTYYSLFLLAFSYILYDISYYLNYKIYGLNMSYCYNKLQSKLLNKLAECDDNFTKHISRGKLLSTINTDVIDIGDMLDQISEFISTLLQLLVTCAIISIINIYVALVLFAIIIVYLYFKNNMDKKANIYLRKQKNVADEYSSLFSQILTGLQEIKTFNMMPKLKNKLRVIENKFEKAYLKKRKYITHREIDSRNIIYLAKILLYIVLVLMLAKGRIDIGIIVLAISYMDTLIDGANDFISVTANIREVSVGIDRINDILNYKPSDVIPYGSCDNDYIDGVVEFKNVDFGYSKNKLIIKNLSFKIMPNTITAIVGQSGNGKTSIINLLLRLYKINNGKILIDGVNIYDYTKKVYYSNVSVVNQKPFIFNMSIRKNLDFVDENIENQIEACKRVGIHDFITSLPQGYNTILRENATNISGGQKQLISLARTILSKSEILLFDEITSSLDPDTAKKIAELLKDLKRDHTVIMITHKPELMKKADRIIVLHEGKIVGDGRHKDLINNNIHYQWLQSRKSISKVGVFDND